MRHEDEEAVAGLDERAAARRDRVVAAHDHDDRGSRQSDFANGRAGDRVIGATTKSRRIERARLADLDQARRGQAGETRSSRAATRSSVVPWRIAETTTTKKTALKIVFAVSTSDESTNVARTIGTAPRSPAQPSSSRSRGEVVERGRHPDRDQVGQEHEQQRRREPRAGDVGQLAREHEQAEHDEERDLGEERQPFVEAASCRR